MTGNESLSLAPLFEIPQGLEKLARRYIDKRRQELPLFEELLHRAEFQEIQRLSHNLKGTGKSYGFPDLSRLGAELETASKAEDSLNIQSKMRDLCTYVETAFQQLSVPA